ncbi:hypothetical protein YC2023_117880 [Brassica napus]
MKTKMNMSHVKSIFRILHSTLPKRSYSNYKSSGSGAWYLSIGPGFEAGCGQTVSDPFHSKENFADPKSKLQTQPRSTLTIISFLSGLMALTRTEPFQKFSRAQDKLRLRRGFGNSFQPAIDAPRLVPNKLRHCPKRKDGFLQLKVSYFIGKQNL